VLCWSDTRKALCYTDIRDDRCLNPSTIPVSRSTCCCMVDNVEPVRIGWGQPCTACPPVDLQEYQLLCPYGPGLTNTGAGHSLYFIIIIIIIIIISAAAAVSSRHLRSFEIGFEFESAVLIRFDSKGWTVKKIFESAVSAHCSS